jgi:antirestriction protein ArdC
MGKTPVDKKERNSALHAKLKEVAARCEDPAQRRAFEQWAACVQNLDGRPYSEKNALVLYEQAAERGMTLTRLGGFHAWLAHGRCVRKGEKGLMVWAPHHRKEDRDGDGEDEEVMAGYHVTFVWDIAQTDEIGADRRPERSVSARTPRVAADGHTPVPAAFRQEERASGE